MSKQSCIYYEKVKKGEKVHSKDGWVFVVTKTKKWNDRTVRAVVIYGPEDQLGRTEKDWCADILYKF